MTEEEYLRERLVDLQRKYQAEAKPFVDRLVELELMKPPAPIFIDAANLPQYIIDQLKKMEDGQ